MTPLQRIGIDTGGTFTDVAVHTTKGVVIHKMPSTPGDPAAAVATGLAAGLPAGAVADLVHGTTVGLNAILTGSLPRTAFVTGKGFLDLIEIGRQARTDIYDLAARKPVPPVPRELRFEIESRRAADGSVLQQPTPTQLARLAARLARSRVEAVAIGLLHSHVDPADELRIAAALEGLGVPITCSGVLLRTRGEYERFCAAILNAALRPIMGRYIGRLRSAVGRGRVRLMRSSGGVMADGEAAEFPARAALSGPAGGVDASRKLAEAMGADAVAAFDMGGTSTDVCLVRADVAREVTHAATLADLPIPLPAVPVHTVGCGGGSIAWVDSGGALRVGPHSAGAEPGPACYGKGTEATVTDAHVALGHLGADTLLGGGFPIDPDRSVRAVETIARRLGVSARAAARGILEVAETTMMRALIVITVARTLDPAGIPLVAYGGAGGLHAAGLARRLSMPRAIVPVHPGAFSAVGLALAGESADAQHPIGALLEHLRPGALRAAAASVARAARRALESGRRARIATEAVVRARGQGAGIPLPFGPGLAARFRTAHAERNGFVPAGDLELVELRARADLAGLALPAAPLGPRRRPVGSPRRPPIGGTALSVYARGELGERSECRGPCVVEEATGTSLVPAGWSATATSLGLVLEPGNLRA